MMHDYPVEIPKFREHNGLSVEKFADKLSVHKRSVERWESGERQPRGEAKRKLDALLAGGATHGRSDSDFSKTNSDRPVLQADDEFFSFLDDWSNLWSEWAEASKEDGPTCDFYFFEPEQLPMFGQQQIQKRWMDNLEKGISYNLFWILSGVSDFEFSRRYGILNSIADKAPSECPARLRIWGLSVGTVDDHVVKKYVEAQRAAESDQHPVLEIKQITTLAGQKDWIRFVRLGGFSLLMVARIRPDFSTRPDKPSEFAVRRFKDVSLTAKGPTETGWLHLSISDTEQIISIIDSTLGVGKDATE